MTQTVLVVRKRLLSYSETFVVAQATHLPTFKPVFAGTQREPSGAALLEGQTVCVQSEYTGAPALSRGVLSLFGRPARRWVDALKAHEPAIVHAHFGPAGVYGLALGRALKLPVVVTFHGYDITQHSADRRYQKQRQQIFSRADKILAISDFIRERLVNAGCPEERVQTHYIGIELPEKSNQAVVRSAVPLVVFVGRLVKQKGCDQLLRAMQRVREKIPDAELQVLGDGPELRALQKQAQEIGGVTFLGRQTPAQVKNALRKAWVLCNPSIVDQQGATEGLGMVFLEAQAAETPAVSYATGGIPEAIINKETGFVVPPGEIEKLADRLVALIEDSELRKVMGSAGRDHVSKNFNLISQCEKLEHLYSELISVNQIF